jgi:coenzyme F420-reducing hydrogenase delta subunit
MDDSRSTIPTPDPVMEREPVAGFEPIIVGLCCHFCAFAAADLAGSMRLQYPPNIRIMRLPCTGKADVIHILRALEDGVDGVFVAGCLEGNCHFTKGNLFAKRRVYYAKKLIKEAGLEPERVEMFNLSSSEGPRFAEIAKQMTERIRRLGPSPLRKRDK